MNKRSLLTILLVPSLLLLVPLAAMRFVDGMDWSVSDFVVAWFLMASAGLAYRVATLRAGSGSYRAAVAVAVAAAFMIVWGNLAVGFIGSEDNPANLLYVGVLVVGIVGGTISRFEARGMALTMAATALTQFLVPVIALAIWQPELTWGVAKVFVFNGFFVMLFIVSALLFRHAARRSGPAASPRPAA